MRHMIAGTKLNRDSDHRMALYRNLVTDLLGYEKITTTEAKARETRIFAEKMITLGKNGTLDARRRVAAFVYDERVVEKVMGIFAERYATRNGGYTRVYKLGARLGDNAQLVVLELVDSEGKKVVNPNDDSKNTKEKGADKKVAAKKAPAKIASKTIAKEDTKSKTAKKTSEKSEVKKPSTRKAKKESE